MAIISVQDNNFIPFNVVSENLLFFLHASPLVAMTPVSLPLPRICFITKWAGRCEKFSSFAICFATSKSFTMTNLQDITDKPHKALTIAPSSTEIGDRWSIPWSFRTLSPMLAHEEKSTTLPWVPWIEALICKKLMVTLQNNLSCVGGVGVRQFNN